MHEAEKLLTVAEVAERLQVPASWVYRHADWLGGLKLGKYRRFEWGTVIERVKTALPGGSMLGRRPNDHN